MVTRLKCAGHTEGRPATKQAVHWGELMHFCLVAPALNYRKRTGIRTPSFGGIVPSLAFQLSATM